MHRHYASRTQRIAHSTLRALNASRTQRFAHSTLRALNASRTQRFTHPEPHPSTSRDTCTTHRSSLDTSKGGEDERGWYGGMESKRREGLGGGAGREAGRQGWREGTMEGPAPLSLITKTLNRIRDKKQHLIDFDFDPQRPIQPVVPLASKEATFGMV